MPSVRSLRRAAAYAARGVQLIGSADALAAWQRQLSSDYREDLKWVAAFAVAAMFGSLQLARGDTLNRAALALAAFFFLLSVFGAMAYALARDRREAKVVSDFRLNLLEQIDAARTLADNSVDLADLAEAGALAPRALEDMTAQTDLRNLLRENEKALATIKHFWGGASAPRLPRSYRVVGDLGAATCVVGFMAGLLLVFCEGARQLIQGL